MSHERGSPNGFGGRSNGLGGHHRDRFLRPRIPQTGSPLGPPPPDDQMHDVDGELSLFIAIKPFSRLFVLVSPCLLPPPLSCRTEPKVPRENFPAVHPSNSEGANGANISSTLTEHLPPAARSPFLALARRSLPPSLRLTEKENSRGKGLSRSLLLSFFAPPYESLPEKAAAAATASQMRVTFSRWVNERGRSIFRRGSSLSALKEDSERAKDCG